jgi:hypothetical protein
MPFMPAQAFGLVLLAASCAACHDEPPVRSVSARAQAVRVETFEPPPGARWVAELEVSDGQGCGIGGQRGSLGNALALCNPACAAHEQCRSDRVCVPMAAQ